MSSVEIVYPQTLQFVRVGEGSRQQQGAGKVSSNVNRDVAKKVEEILRKISNETQEGGKSLKSSPKRQSLSPKAGSNTSPKKSPKHSPKKSLHSPKKSLHQQSAEKAYTQLFEDVRQQLGDSAYEAHLHICQARSRVLTDHPHLTHDTAKLYKKIGQVLLR